MTPLLALWAKIPDWLKGTIAGALFGAIVATCTAHACSRAEAERAKLEEKALDIEREHAATDEEIGKLQTEAVEHAIENRADAESSILDAEQAIIRAAGSDDETANLFNTTFVPWNKDMSP